MKNLNLFDDLKESYFNMELELDEKDGKIKKFSLGCKSAKKIQIFSQEAANFIAVLLSKGDIKSHGDSFYQIKDFEQKQCVNQLISSLYLENDELFIEGVFSDCPKS